MAHLVWASMPFWRLSSGTRLNLGGSGMDLATLMAALFVWDSTRCWRLSPGLRSRFGGEQMGYEDVLAHFGCRCNFGGIPMECGRLLGALSVAHLPLLCVLACKQCAEVGEFEAIEP